MANLSQGRLIGRRALSGAALCIAACTAEAPVPEPAVQPLARIELDSNRTVEIIGLRRWTADMLRDSLAKYSPDEGLDSEAVAANLRNLLGFADASTTMHAVVFDEDDRAIITVAVREPTDSARVQYAAQQLDSISLRAEWRDLIKTLDDSTGRMFPVVAAAHLEGLSRIVVDSTRRGRTFAHREGYAFESPADSSAAMPVLAALAAKKTDADYQAAVQTIETSTSAPDRALATLILANFPERDGAWRALLVAAVGREQGRDAWIAQRALRALSERSSSTVDWSPVTETIHDVLDGTALAALAPLAQALTATGATTSHAQAYLAGGGEMLTAMVESDNPEIRDAAHDLLVKLRGQDLGFEPEPWRAWIKTLTTRG